MPNWKMEVDHIRQEVTIKIHMPNHDQLRALDAADAIAVIYTAGGQAFQMTLQKERVDNTFLKGGA